MLSNLSLNLINLIQKKDYHNFVKELKHISQIFPNDILNYINKKEFLIYAIQSNSNEIVRLLINMGASLMNVISDFEQNLTTRVSVLTVAIKSNNYSAFEYLLTYPEVLNHLNDFYYINITSGTRPQNRSDMTLLQYSIYCGRYKFLKKLIELGAKLYDSKILSYNTIKYYGKHENPLYHEYNLYSNCDLYTNSVDQMSVMYYDSLLGHALKRLNKYHSHVSEFEEDFEIDRRLKGNLELENDIKIVILLIKNKVKIDDVGILDQITSFDLLNLIFDTYSDQKNIQDYKNKKLQDLLSIIKSVYQPNEIDLEIQGHFPKKENFQKLERFLRNNNFKNQEKIKDQQNYLQKDLWKFIYDNGLFEVAQILFKCKYIQQIDWWFS